MKQKWLIFTVLLFVAIKITAYKVNGIIFDKSTKKRIDSAIITLKNEKVISDKKGTFEFENIPTVSVCVSVVLNAVPMSNTIIKGPNIMVSSVLLLWNNTL